MAGCDILDIQCLFVSELIGSVTLTIVLATIFYFLVASKMKFGFDTTIALSIPVLLIFASAFGGFSIVFAFATIIAAIIIAWLFDRMTGNK